MALIYCQECGKQISDQAFSCPHCGYQYRNVGIQQPHNTTIVQYKPKIPGRGFGISSMIMGILGAYFGLVCLSTLSTSVSINTLYYEYSSAYLTGVIIGSSIYPTIFGILALSFGYASRARGFNKGQRKAGIILGVISLALCLLFLIIGTTMINNTGN